MLQVFKKKVIWIPTVIVLSVVILIVIAWPFYKKATHKTYAIYENLTPNVGTFQESCQMADLIVQCKVSQIGDSMENEWGSVYTPVTLQINKTYKGDRSLQQVVLYEQYGEYKNATWQYYSPETTPQIPMKMDEPFILHLRKAEEEKYALTFYGSFASISGNAVVLNPYILEVQSLPGIGDDLTIPLSEFEALIADNL